MRLVSRPTFHVYLGASLLSFVFSPSLGHPVHFKAKTKGSLVSTACPIASLQVQDVAKVMQVPFKFQIEQHTINTQNQAWVTMTLQRFINVRPSAAIHHCHSISHLDTPVLSMY